MDNKNLPAYPNLDSYENGAPCTPQHGRGLSKREAFAKAAMTALLSNPTMMDSLNANSLQWLGERTGEIADIVLTHLENSSK